jgi:hypothetical protein
MRPSLALVLGPVLLAACGGATATAPAVASPAAPAASACDDACVIRPPVLAHKLPPSSCGGLTGGVLGKIVVAGQPAEVPATIVATSSCGSFPARLRSGGVFSLGELPQGIYVIHATVGSQASAYTEATVRAGEVLTLELDLDGADVERGKAELDRRQACGCPVELQAARR